MQKIKKNLAKLIIAFAGCIIVLAVHHLGYEWYMTYFTPRSRGVGLGFVNFYMRYIVIPITFLAAFIKPKNSSVIFGLVIIFMLYSWYEINPLRVMLMLISSSTGYVLVISLRSIYMNYSKQTKPNNN
ncbi:hypothetical protein [Enterobacter mori]|uniref:hypothetical protein n=1 Tax=Enterobacter mori TaxID=539813 RepID=UPI003B83C06C